MRLLSCHINNFGALSSYDLKFEDGLNSFFQANGSGKTTLADFLEAMFYGLERNTKGNIKRKRYFPFNGGAYGGSVSFIHQGHKYLVARTFDKTSETRDSFELHIDGVKQEKVGSNLGEDIFKINRESFRRTCYFASFDLDTQTTSDIGARLTDVLQGTDDSLNVAETVEHLKDAKKKYKKDKGDSGLIDQTEKSILLLKNEIFGIEDLENSLVGKKKESEEKKSRIKELEEKIEAEQKKERLLQDRDRYLRLKEKSEKNLAAVAAIEKNYPFGIPKDEEITKAEADLALLRENKRLFESLDDEQSNQRFASLESKFRDSDLDESQLSSINQKVGEANSLKELLENPRIGELRQRFQHSKPKPQDFDDLKSLLRDYQATQARIEDEKVNGPRANFKTYLFFFVGLMMAFVGLLCGAVGGFFLSQNASVIGLPFLIFGGVVIVLGALLAFLRRPSKVKQDASNDPHKSSYDGKMEAIKNEAMAIVAPYGFKISNGFEETVEDFISAYGEFEKVSIDLERLDKLRKELSKTFIKYDIHGTDFGSNAIALTSSLSEYRAMVKEREQKEEKRQKASKENEGANNSLMAFAKKYHFKFDDLESSLKTVKEEMISLKGLKSERAGIQQGLDEFKDAESLTNLSGDGVADLSSLKEDLNALRSSEVDLLTQIQAGLVQVERLGELKSSLAEEEEKLEVYKSKFRLLGEAVSSLEKADDSLRDKYLKPLAGAFRKFAKPLEEAMGDGTEIGKDFKLKVMSDGKLRDEFHLSSGQRTLLALSFRLALIENIFQDEKPFLVFDDPFLGLDEEHLGKVRTLISEIAPEQQIIYFTCHPSRKL